MNPSSYAQLALKNAPKPGRCVVASAHDVIMGNCDVDSNLYWDLSGIEKEKIGKIKLPNGKCMTYNSEKRFVISSCDDAKEFYLSNGGNLRSAESLNSRRPTNYSHDGCIGYTDSGKLFFDESGYGKNSRSYGDDSRECQRKFKIKIHPKPKETVEKTCNPLTRGPDLSRVCNVITGEWVPKSGYAPRLIREITAPMTNLEYNMPQAPEYTCDNSIKPRGRVYCDQDTNSWKCKTNYGGVNCDEYTGADLYILRNPFDPNW